jgi:Right handed beta helix region
MATKKFVLTGVCIGLLVLSILIPSPAKAANTYYVSPSGNDSNPGTQTQPWKTIQKAANTLAAGDKVVVAAGDYSTQRVNISKSGASGAPITYQAQGQVVMKGFVIQASYITVDGFEIANTDYKSWDQATSAGIYLLGANNLIENNYIHDAALEGIFLVGWLSDGSNTKTANNVIRNNRLYHNEMLGIDVNGRNNLIENNEVWGTVQCMPKVVSAEGTCSNSNGLDADGMRFYGQGHIFRGNYIHDIPYGPPGTNPSSGDYNGDAHIDCFQTWSDSYYEVASNILFEQNRCVNLQSQGMDENGTGWMITSNASNITIRNNIIETYAGIDGALGGVRNLLVYNNLFVNSTSFNQWYPKAILVNSGETGVIRNNIFYNQPRTAIDGSSSGVTSDHNLTTSGATPKFVDSANHDYHLQAGSPAIDTGIAVDVTNDFDNGLRPQGAGFDLGAFEVQSSSQPTHTPTSTSPATATLQPTNTPLSTSTPTRTATFTATATLKPTNTPQPTASSTPTRTATFTATATQKPTNTAQATKTPMPSSTPTRTATFTATATQKPTNTAQPTNTPMPSSTRTRTATFTATATQKPTNTPAASLTPTRTATWTATATLKPTNTLQPSNTPLPTHTITPSPTFTPTVPLLGTVALFLPADGTALLNNQPTFEWSEIGEAASYTIQISKNSTFSQLVTNATVTAATYTPTAYLPAGKTLYWRVRAKLAAGFSPWSAAYSIHTAMPPSVPKLLKPANKALVIGYTPALDWSNSSVSSGGADFDHYLLQVATDVNFAGATEITVSGLANSQYTFPSELDANAQYYWRVRAYKTNGEVSTWSSVRNFRTAIQPPRLQEPEEGSSTVERRPTFTWTEVEGASSYVLRISKSSTFSSSIVKVTVTAGSYTPLSDLPVGTWYWRVQAKGANGPSLWSETRSLIEN